MENQEQIKLKKELLDYIRKKKNQLKKELSALDNEENEITDEVNKLEKVIRL